MYATPIDRQEKFMVVQSIAGIRTRDTWGLKVDSEFVILSILYGSMDWISNTKFGPLSPQAAHSRPPQYLHVALQGYVPSN